MSTKKNIVYLLGAGASFHCIPIVGKMPARLRLFIDLLIDYLKNSANDEGIIEKITQYYVLIDEIEFYGTPDTLARKYYLANNKDNLNKLKYFLSAFFVPQGVSQIIRIRVK